MRVVANHLHSGGKFIIHNAAFDVSVLRNNGINLPAGSYIDTMVLAHCIDNTRQSVSLASYGNKVSYRDALVAAGYWDPSVKGDGYYDLPYNDVMVSYCLQDLAATALLWEQLYPHLYQDAKLAASYWGIHLPFVEVMISLGMGMHVNRGAALTVATNMMVAIEETQDAFYNDYPSTPKLRWNKEEQSYEPVYVNGQVKLDKPNLQSPNDVCSLLFVAGWVPTEFKPDTKRPITSQAVMFLLANSEATPPKVKKLAKQIQELRSLLGVFAQLTKLIELTIPSGDASMVYGSWHSCSTTTRRMSSSGPNMQNFSTRHPVWGPQFRACFTPPPGYAMLVGDLSQIELTILAWYLETVCKDSAMAEGNRAGRDAHDTNTENWYGVTKEDPTFKAQRAKAKNGIFAAGYGAMAKRLSFTLGIALDDAEEILQTVATSTEINPLKEKVWAALRTTRNVLPVNGSRSGFLYDCKGSRYRYPDIDSQDRKLRAKDERRSFNCLMQGGCSSIMRELLNECIETVNALGGWVSAIVHDEAIIYLPLSSAEAGLHVLNTVFNRMVLPSEQGGVRVRADFHIVSNWSEK